MTLYELFERQRRYVVPLFQRPYVWTREGQWEALWEDILAKVEEVLERQRPRPHFLGAIVLSQRDHFGRELDASDIIDGQQRLTTLQVLLAAFRDLVATTNDSRLHDELRRLTTNDGIKEHDYEVYKVWPTNADRPVLEAVVSAGSLERLSEQFPPKISRRRAQPRPLIVEAYLYFREAILELAGEPRAENEPLVLVTDKLYALFEALRRMLHLVVIELEEDDDPQVIFETLNATGVPLLPSDLIRNFVFLRASREGADVDTLYRQWWQEYDERKATSPKEGEERFWKIKDKQGRITRPRLDLFIIHYLSYRREREVAHSHLFKEFCEWWDSDRARKVGTELNELRRYSNIFAGFVEPDATARVGRFALRLRTLDTSTVYPLLLFLLGDKQVELSAADLDQVIVDLESYLVRRAICGLTIKNYNRFFPSVQRELREAQGSLSQVLRERLLADSGEAVRWPDDREFERAWLQTPAYERHARSGRVNMVLEAIEREMRTSKQEQIVHTGPLTIEHIMPQGWREFWPAPTPLVDLGPDDETAEERRDQLVHTFGNLTLLTQPLNSAVSNGSFDKKRPEIAQQSSLRLNTVFQTVTHWDEDAILGRGRALFAYAQRIWPFPVLQRESLKGNTDSLAAA